MKKVVKFLAVVGFILMPFLFVGCSATQQQYALDSGMIAVESSVLKSQYEKVEKLLRQVQTEKQMFTEEEWRGLMNVDSTIDMLILKFDAMAHFDMSGVSVMDIQFMYRLAAEGYITGRGIIYNHWDELQPSTQLLLSSFDKQADSTSKRIEELLANPSNTNINQALTLISGVVSIAVKMLGVAVL